MSQQVLRCLNRSSKAWKQTRIAYPKNPSKFLGIPKLPKYKDKDKRSNFLVYTIHGIRAKKLRKGLSKPSGTNLMFSCHKADINEVRMVLRLNYYVVEVIYSQPRQQLVKGTEVASVDIGWNNLAAITSNPKGFQPFLINGRPVKAINNYNQKQKSQLQSFLKKNRKTSNCIQRLSTKRNLRRSDARLWDFRS